MSYLCLLAAVLAADPPHRLTVADVIAPSLAAGGARPVKPTRNTQEPAQVFVADFADDFFLDRDLQLQGVGATETLHFTVPRDWVMADDPRMLLSVDHAPELLPATSVLAIAVNGTRVGGARLDATLAPGTVALRIPRALLRDHNTLTIEAAQRTSAECEDPLSPLLWTTVSRESTITFWYRSAPAANDAPPFPQPLVDRLRPGRPEVAVELAGADPAALAPALGVLAAAMARSSDYRGLTLFAADDPRVGPSTPTLVLGVVDDLPAFGSAIGTMPGAGGRVVTTRHPGRPAAPTIIVTGFDVRSIEEAARGLTQTGRVPGAAPDWNAGPVSLEALGVGNQTVRGLAAPPVKIPLRLAGDARLAESGHLSVHYGYAAGLDPSLSRMEVVIDGVVLRSMALAAREGEEDAWLDTGIPAGSISPSSVIEVRFVLFPSGMARCRVIDGEAPWASVYGDSSLALVLEHGAWLPDLGLLRHRFWPFDGDGRGGPVVVTLPASADADLTVLGAQVTALLARHARNPGALPSLRVDGGHEPPRAEVSLRVAGAAPPRLEQRATAGGDRMALTASSTPALRSLVESLGDPDVVAALAGSAAEIENGEVARVEMAPQAWVAEAGRARLRGLWPEVTAAGLLLLTGSAAGIRRWARARGGVVD